MSPRRSTHSSRERAAQRSTWVNVVRGRWRRLAFPHVLNKRETSVLSLRLGLTGSPVSQRVIGARFGLSIPTIVMLERAARRKVATALAREEARA